MFKTIKKRTFLIKLCAVFAAVVIAALSFLSGCSSDTKSWMLKTIEKNYYFYDDFDKSGLDELSPVEISARLDMYSRYYTAEEYEAEYNDNQGSKSGVGLYTNFIEGRGVYVVSVVGNSPASIAGIAAGDILTGGKRNGEVTPFNAPSDFPDFVSSFGTGEKFSLISAEKEFEVSRENYTASYAYMATCDTAWEFVSSADGGLALSENPSKARAYLPDDAAYINLSQFFGTAAGEVGALLKKFNASHKTSLFLDLRNNGGGYVSVMQDIAGYFTSTLYSEAQVAMIAEYRSGKKQLWKTYMHEGDSLVPKDTNVYVLANSGTASASEALIGVLVSYGFLKYENIFISDYSEEYLEWAGGEEKTAQTYGKGIMQSTFVKYPQGDALKLTTALIKWPNDKCIHGVALSAKDGCTIVPAEWSATKNDGELQKVVEIIAGR